MPITFELKPEQQLVIFRHIGDVPDDEFLTFYKDFFENPKATAYQNLLIDLAETKSVSRSSEALQALIMLLREKLKHSSAQRKVAVIAPEDLSFGLARMYEIFSNDVPWEFEVFREGHAAQAWLGVT